MGNSNSKSVEVAEDVIDIVTLRSSEGELFEVPMSAMREAETIKNMVDDDHSTDIIPFPNIESSILTKVIEYCIRHAEPNTNDIAAAAELKLFDKNFVHVDQYTLSNLIIAAHHMRIQSLLDLTCKTVADQIKDKTVEEIRSYFHVINDFTQEEEEDVRRESSWAFE